MVQIKHETANPGENRWKGKE